ncbi:MAG: type II toxin-antitoxin system VapC family toxin [Archangium sp.]
MTTTLVDTGPLVALVEPADRHHEWSRRLFDSLKGELVVSPLILVETHFLLPFEHQRARLRLLLRNEFSVRAPKNEGAVCDGALDWLSKYAEHSPDFVDAYLVAWHEAEKASRVWTLNSEFLNVWRTSKGKRPHLAAAPPSAQSKARS